MFLGSHILPTLLPFELYELNGQTEAGLVQERKVGREHRYQLNPETLRGAHDWLARYEQFWDEKLTNLKAYIENKEDIQE